MDNQYNALFHAAFSAHGATAEEEEAIRELYKREGKTKFKEYVKKRKFVPFVSNLLCEMGYKSDGWEELRDYYTERNMCVINCLDDLFKSFERYSVDRVVVVENFGAFLAANADPMWRFGSGDVDLYGDITQKDQIYMAAKAVGYTYEERYSGNNLISTSFSNKHTLPENFYFDIGWFPTARLKIPFLNYREEAVDWKRTRLFGNTSIRLPDKESLLYICMLHISVHNFSRQPDIRLYIDIQNSLACGDIDWDKIIRWAKRDGYTNRIATVAYLAKQLIDCDIPDEVMHLCDGKNHDKLLAFVYDQDKNVLVAKPGAIDSVKVEMYANDKSAIAGLMGIVFPPATWLKMTYSYFLPLAYVKYIIGLL